MNRYKGILIALSLLSFAACGSSGGGDSGGSSVKLPSSNTLLSVNGMTKTNNGTITLTEDNYPQTDDMTYYAGEVALGENSKVINKGKITSNGIKFQNKDGSGWSEYGNGMDAESGATVENDGEISGKLARGMDAEGTGSIVLNNKDIKNLSAREETQETRKGVLYTTKDNISAGISVEKGAKGINSKTGEISGEMIVGMTSSDSGSRVTNYGKINLVAPEYSEEHIENGKNIIDKNGSFYGMYSEDGSSSINQNNISLNGEKSVGIGMVGKNSVLTNGNQGTIEGDNLSVGMGITSNSTAVNNGLINLENTKGNEEIDIKSKKAVGMEIDIDKDENTNGKSIITNEKTIKLKDDSIGMGITLEKNAEAYAINNGDIYLNGKNNIGMYASGEGAHLENGKNGVIHLSGESEENRILDATSDSSLDGSGLSEFGKDNHGNIAMKIEDGATMVNKGKIEFEVEPSLTLAKSIETSPMTEMTKSIETSPIYIINKELKVNPELELLKSTETSPQIKLTKSTKIIPLMEINNKLKVSPEIKLTEIIKTTGKAEDIKLSNIYSNDLLSKTPNELNGIGYTIAGLKNPHIYSPITMVCTYDNYPGWGNIENKGRISGNAMYGMFCDGFFNKAINDGTINISSYMYSAGMASIGSTIINSQSGEILGESSIGMYDSGTRSKAINDGKIDIHLTDNKTYYGMYIRDGGVGINNGNIYLSGKNGIGMYARGKGSRIENDGTIHLSGSRIDGKGDISSAEDGVGGTEFGIDNNGNVAMKIDDGATMINKGCIVFTPTKILAPFTIPANYKGYKIPKITNEYGHEISISESNAMSGGGVGVEIDNKGIINVTSDEKITAYGMKITGGAMGINTGNIYLKGKSDIGMYASDKNSKIINGTTGIIYLNGTRTDGTGDISSAEDGHGLSEFGKDNHGNIAMKIENGATMINKGKIVFEGK